VIKIKFANKSFSYYWKCIKIPIYILLGWYLAAIITAKVSMDLYISIFSGWGGALLVFLLFGFSGYMIVADHKGKPKNAAWTGALVGIIGGFAGALVGILMVFIAPEMIEFAVKSAVAQGAPEDLVRTMMGIMSYVQLIVSPLINGLLGALFGWIGGLIAKKK